jgi:host factor-I protein
VAGQSEAGKASLRARRDWSQPIATIAQQSKWGGEKMASDKPQNLQDTFLNHVRKNKTSLTIFLVNGVKLQGVITWFDNFCVLLRRDGHSQLVYKHAISTIMPGTPVQLYEAEGEAAESVA